MTHPILAEVIRGAIIESVHRGSIAVVDADGAQFLSVGTVDKPVYPRSAMKMIQALPLMESGAADAYGLGNVELSLACASHSSEPAHVETAGKMLTAAGLGVDDMDCGAHWPLIGEAGAKATIELARDGGKPTQLHNNCSGKHAGFLCCAKHSGMDIENYLDPDHALQREVVATMENVTGEAIPGNQCGVDGCSAPTLAASLKGLAQGFAKMATGIGLEPVRARSAKRLMQACMAEPWYMAGTGRFCTRVMEMGQGRIFVKVGAEGVYTGAIPELGLGIALKADDGAERAAEMMLAGVLGKLLGQDSQLGSDITALSSRTLKNWNGIKTGEMRSAGL